MWRCEEEIILKINPANVVNVLVKYFPALNRDLKDSELETLEEEKVLESRREQNSDNFEELKSPLSNTADQGLT